MMTKVLAVTGYKAHELGIFDDKHKGISYIKKAFEKRIMSFIDEGLEWVIISGQLGVELWVAEVVLQIKNQYPIQLGILTPFLNQEKNWNESKQQLYNYIMANADFVDSISKKEYENPIQLRLKNKYIIEKTEALLVLYNDENPGSPRFYIDEAMKKQARNPSYEIYYITPEDIEDLVREELYESPSDW